MMRRTPMAQSTKPMKRSGFNPKFAASSSLTTPMRKPTKSRRPKMTPIRRAAKGQDCTLRLPGICNFNIETTVLCHSPYLKDGRGMGLKSPDECAVFGCSNCHDVLDKRVFVAPSIITAEEIEIAFRVALKRTHSILEMMGLL
jgi:hypothetical protein